MDPRYVADNWTLKMASLRALGCQLAGFEASIEALMREREAVTGVHIMTAGYHALAFVSPNLERMVSFMYWTRPESETRGRR